MEPEFSGLFGATDLLDHRRAIESIHVYGRIKLLPFRVSKHNFYQTSGWNRRTGCNSRVNDLQRARDTPLKTWLLVERDGNVSMTHSNSMAGVNEACSHVRALLFAIEAGVRMSQLYAGRKSAGG